MTKKSQPPVTKTTKPAVEATPAPTVKAKRQPANVASGAPAKRKPAPVASGSKIDTVVNMLRTKPGASLEQLSKATGWQHHSVRGAISGNVKKKLGLNVTSERVNGVRIYRIGK